MERGAQIRKWLRIIHRELSYVFAGMLLVYAISGIALNHKATFNSSYRIERTEYQLPAEGTIDQWLTLCGVGGKEIQHYNPDENTLKVFLKGNSTLTVDMTTHIGVLEQVKKRPVLGNLSKLHYNMQGKAWTWFSDIFAIALVLIVLSGLFMLKGKHGLWGIGGIELAVGILIPLLFILL
ncbi:MAG: PepSY-associated TM helix domain-containing protein [Paludibacteraceae bacterium]|nr:PepSY-associated TM helix domain-containing protein [Paludibacteraceae bacterium]